MQPMTSLSPAPQIASMTGYGGAQSDCAAGRLSLEIKSVNSRFFEFTARMPDEFRWLESVMREAIQKSVRRGKVELRVNLTRSEASLAATQVSESGLSSALRLSHQIRTDHPEIAPFTVADLLKIPGVIREPELSNKDWQKLFMDLLGQAINQFSESRRAEGTKLCELIEMRLKRIEEHAQSARAIMPQAILNQQQKLTDRLLESVNTAASTMSTAAAASSEAMLSLSERIRQEVALFGLRVDVAEEIDRLQSHIDAARQALGVKEASKSKGALHASASESGIGKRLDFLAQEMNREANTLGSKSPSPDLSALAIEIKLLIEQIREQVQNLE